MGKKKTEKERRSIMEYNTEWSTNKIRKLAYKLDNASLVQ
jgi:hypothetical protein